MRIPDDVEELVLAFMDQEKKADLRKMSREQIDTLIMGEIGCAVEPGYLAKNEEPGAFPFKVTERGREILKILAPCKRSGR
jgi:DNA-binding sugar fermentation-stimulating protein